MRRVILRPFWVSHVVSVGLYWRDNGLTLYLGLVAVVLNFRWRWS